jgi:Cft2 family RNA processing exonuclease
MFHYDRGLKLTGPDLGVDLTRRQKRGFISHAHRDHMARHELALCSPETARLYHLLLGHRPVLELPWDRAIDFGGLRLSIHPAGHCLGSAMLLAEDDKTSLLYTGDFKLRPSLTVPPAAPPRARQLVIESTYGDPRRAHGPREEASARVVDWVRRTLEQDRIPVVRAYALGKAQEVTRLLTAAGIVVMQHPKVFEISQVYERCGVPLGTIRPWRGRYEPGTALVAPPSMHRDSALEGLKRSVSLAVTGWAAEPGFVRRFGAEAAIPLSDHADFNELIEAIELVAPDVIYCTHGSPEFVAHLRRRGYPARVLGAPQRDLNLF